MDRVGNLILIAASAAGFVFGYLIGRIEKLIATRGLNAMIRELLDRVQSYDPSSYQQMRKLSDPGRRVAYGEDGGHGMPTGPDLYPWRSHPDYEGADVVFDWEEGVVHITGEEDTYEEDVRLFLHRFNLTEEDVRDS